MQKIGILLPRSTYYADIGIDMLEGLRSGLRQLGGGDIAIAMENIGFGADKRACYAAAERLLFQEDVQVVFAYIGHRMAQLLRPLFMSMNRILIVLDAGSSLPQEWPASPNIIYHSLHNALAYWLTAEMALRDGYKEMGTVSGFYDGGYLQTYAMAQGCHRNGGSIVYNHATGYQEGDFTMAPMAQHFDDHPGSCAMVLFSGDYVQWFFKGMQQHAAAKQASLYASGYTLEESVLETINYPQWPVKGIVPWSYQLNNEANRLFKETLAEKGRKANLFSLLGWEAALLAIALLPLLREEKGKGRETLARFRELQLEGPRGTIRYHEATRHTISPFYEVSLVPDAAQKTMLSVNAVVAQPDKAYESMVAEELGEALSGWYNSYVCI